MGIRTPAHTTEGTGHVQRERLPISQQAFSDNRASTAMQFKQQQGFAASAAMLQLKAMQQVMEPNVLPAQRALASPNQTGMPDNLKSGIESLSGMSMDSVRVHYNSSKPAQLNAHAYAQGTDIHIAPGQEQHLPHEAWHVVQQAQGRVQPTMQMKAGVPVNDDAGLEQEADVMGAKALQMRTTDFTQLKACAVAQSMPIQLSSVSCTSAQYTYNQGAATETVGRSMEAYLEDNTPINGSAPGDGEQAGLMGYLKNTKTFKSMKRGHLMNGQLGGPGIASNLFPITTKANNDHKWYVENHIKQALANGVGVIYQVNVNSELNADATLNGAAEFKCNSWVWDPTQNIIDLATPQPFASTVILSTPQAGSTGGGGIQGGVAVNPKINFLTKNLPSGWGEKKKGLQHWSGNLPGHYSHK